MPIRDRPFHLCDQCFKDWRGREGFVAAWWYPPAHTSEVHFSRFPTEKEASTYLTDRQRNLGRRGVPYDVWRQLYITACLKGTGTDAT